MVQIALNNATWSFDAGRPLGRAGGFGAVYFGTSADGSEVAVKQLHVDAAASAGRELKLAGVLSGRRLTHVMPVLDAGLDADSDRYYIVMPMAAHSLQTEIDRHGAFSAQDAARILLQISRGLEEVSDIVHRDLKPDNVLWHEGVWKIADFGIARFVEESTSFNTLRGALSPQYAAPEQWRTETATAATDLYSLGCIAHTLVTGHPPFIGDVARLRMDHELTTAPDLKSGDSRLDSLTSQLLRKSPETRPSRARVLLLLDGVGSSDRRSSSAAIDRLREIGAVEAQRTAAEEALRQRELSDERARASLFQQASQSLDVLARALLASITDAMPTVQPSALSSTYSVRARAALLEVRAMGNKPVPRGAMPRLGWDVIATARIGVTQGVDQYQWQASLYYMRKQSDPEYRWFEISFFSLAQSARFQPFPLEPEEADSAIGPGLHSTQFAFGPVSIDDEDSETFQHRWIELFVRAYRAQLRHPPSLPLPSNGL